MAFYDVFAPPRVLSVESVHVDPIPIDGEASFTFSSPINPRAVGFTIFAESDVLQSKFVDIKIPKQEITTRLVTISNLTIEDSDGNGISNIPLDSTVNIGSKLLFQSTANDRVQPYTYYVQIKQSGQTPYVEFLDSAKGNFHGNPSEDVSINWTPDEPGLYFIETLVWDNNDIPISSKGPVSIIMVS